MNLSLSEKLSIKTGLDITITDTCRVGMDGNREHIYLLTVHDGPDTACHGPMSLDDIEKWVHEYPVKMEAA